MVALVTAPILYVWEVMPAHWFAVPVINPGVAGAAGFTTTVPLAQDVVLH